MHPPNGSWHNMITAYIIMVGIYIASSPVEAVTLLNGAETQILSNVSASCLTAFNTSLSCNSQVQLLSYDMDRLEWTQAKLAAMCTPSCLSGLQHLDSVVSSSCAGQSISFNGEILLAHDVVDLFVYKYNMSCLTDTSTKAFCLMVEDTWDVGALVAAGNVTWPTNTNITFPDFMNNMDGEPFRDVDGTLVDISEPPLNFTSYGLVLPLTGQDYYQNGTAPDWTGHGWPEPLEYDEYPLEIQCSDCFLAQYKLGVESKWGEVYDEVSDQVWRNIQKNCHLNWEIVPANNLSTWRASAGPLVWQAPISTDTFGCARNIHVNNTASGGTGAGGAWTVNDLARNYDVPSASIFSLNAIFGFTVQPGNYCMPEPCQVARVGMDQSAWNYATYHTNITTAQFWIWNPRMDPYNLIAGDIVCVGPPGGAYTPIAGYPASPSVYTTTASPAYPTASGTIANCGHYYEVVKGDECDTVSLAFSLTLSQFLAMNPSLNADCTNLLVGFDYCVALVNGTTVTTPPPSKSTTTVASHSSTSFASAPTQTVTGTTNQCYKWYVTKSGDTCATIDSEFGITLSTFISLNTYIDQSCDNLWVGYAYCVSGIAKSGATTTTKAASSTSKPPPSSTSYTPAPTQTVTGTTSKCNTWFVVKSGDTCATIESAYGITLSTFIALNTYIDQKCDNLWAGYAYCVKGVPQG